MQSPKAVFIAFGTKGDVLPIAAVAAGLAKARQHYSVYFISHVAHEGSLRRPFSFPYIKFIPVQSPPVVSAADTSQNEETSALEESTSVACEGQVCQEGWKLNAEHRHREECIKAMNSVFGSDVIKQGSFVVINFFALEGWHLAELYQIPCVVAAPYVVPYCAPTSFEQRFRARQPLLYSHLKRAIPGKVGWADVLHWMWALFAARWTEWRLQRLHLSACPFTDPITDLPISYNWPHKPIILYGFSKEVVECPSYWPDSTHICGFWFLSEDLETRMESQTANSNGLPHLELGRFLKGCSIAPIFVGLSSMGSMGHIHNPQGMLCVLRDVLEAADRKAILFTAAYAPLDDAIREVAALYEGPITINHLTEGVSIYNGRLFCFSGDLPYLWLFPKCSIIIHHGGSGTTAAAIRSGIPQIICPFMLDQFYWAERMSWIGVAPDPLRKENLIPLASYSIDKAMHALLHAMEEASTSMMQACAAAFGEQIRKEDGVANAVEVLCNELCV